MADYSSDVKFVDDDPYVGSNVSERGGLLDYGRGKEKRRSRDWEAMRTDPDTMAAQLEFEYGIDPDLALYLFQKEYNANGSGFVNIEEKIRGAISSVADIFRESVSIINKEEFKSQGAEGYTTNVSAQAGTERQDLIIKRLNEEGYIPFSSNEEFRSVFSSDSGAREAIQNGEEIDFDSETNTITYNGESYNTDSRADSEQNVRYLNDIKNIKNSNLPQEEKDKVISSIKSRLNDSRANVGLDADYTDLGASKGASQMDHLKSLKAKGSQSNAYEDLLGNGQTQEGKLELVREAQENAQSHSDAMYKDSQTAIKNPNEMAGREAEAISLGLTGSDKERFMATGISTNASSQGTTGANQVNSEAVKTNQDAYNALINGEDVVEPDDTNTDDLDPGNANNQIDPDDTGVTPDEESSGELEESGSSFSGTVAKDDPYRELLGGQLGQGISDSLAGRPSNSLLAGERMGAEAMARASADNMGVASQGVSNAGMIGQGAAINATQVVGRHNLQQLGDLSAKNTALRGKEQLDARGQAQNYLSYSEGVRQNKVAEDQMKLDSLLDWYRETKSTHVGQADAILDQFDNLADVNMTADQKAYQIEQANKVGEEGASSDLFTSLKDQGYKQQIASMFQKDPETGRYVRHQNGQTYAVDDTTQAMIDAELNLGEVQGLSYNSNGTLTLDDRRTFESSLGNAFVAGDMQGIYNSSQYIENTFTSSSGMLDSDISSGDVVMVAGHPAYIMDIDYSLGQVTYRDHNNDVKVGYN